MKRIAVVWLDKTKKQIKIPEFVMCLYGWERSTYHNIKNGTAWVWMRRVCMYVLRKCDLFQSVLTKKASDGYNKSYIL